MGFESLSETYNFKIKAFPERWLPLIYLYDPDLPLFPLYYFHIIDPKLKSGHRPGAMDRVYGFVPHLSYSDGDLTVAVALNKNLKENKNQHLISGVENEIKKRLGLTNPVKLEDVTEAFTDILEPANKIIEELWYKIVEPSFGKTLPFGEIWDKVFGLVRWVSSWNSDGGRKGELIQTHCFASDFGERIQTGGGHHVDFYLFPTFEELTDTSNPLNHFPKIACLVDAADEFVKNYCEDLKIENMKFSAFKLKKLKKKGSLDTPTILKLIDKANKKHRTALFNNYNAFNRGPHRSVIFLMMLHDLRQSYWDPKNFTPKINSKLYIELKGSYQTPKVIQLYAQQSFGVENVLPIDNWIETFLKWPLNITGFSPKSKKYYQEVFNSCSKFGKIERLVWLACQARKVHSSVCADILWCIRFGGPKKMLRGANPLSCKICFQGIRDVCPAFLNIKEMKIGFNIKSFKPSGNNLSFNIRTANGNNKSPSQTFISCEGKDLGDEYSYRDVPSGFSLFPNHPHSGEKITVADFIKLY
jgi:hypothetical protein